MTCSTAVLVTTRYSGVGNDTYFVDTRGDIIVENFGEGIDTAIVTMASYTMAANLENVEVSWTSGAAITGNDSNNELEGDIGNDTLNGGFGDDALFGGDGNDTLDGGMGNDTMIGGAGHDTFVFESGFGSDVIADFTAGSDELEFQASVFTNAADVLAAAHQVGSNVVINITPFHTITLDNFSLGSLSANNIVIVGSPFAAIASSVSSANNAIGTAGNDVLASTSAPETLTGNGGNDVYRFAQGGGQDVIINGSAASTVANGELDFGPDISANQLWFARSGSDLSISVMGSQDKINVAGWYDGGAAQLREIKTADGSEIDTQLSQLVQAMASYSAGHAGFDPLREHADADGRRPAKHCRCGVALANAIIC